MLTIDPQKIIQEAYDRVKLGSGLTGKLTVAFVALSGVLAMAAYGLSGHVGALIFIAVTAVIVFLAFCAGLAVYVIKYPAQALLEGADLIKWRQLDMSAADPSIITSGPNTLPPPEVHR